MDGCVVVIATKGERWSRLAARAVAAPSLTATHVRVLATIGIYADRGGIAWPSQETIAGIVGIDRATVCRAPGVRAIACARTC